MDDEGGIDAVIENNRASSPRDKDLVGLLNTGLGTA
jgi:hypothetical protein